jgi:hypothetical protein
MMRRVGALARYALANNIRTPYTWAGGALFAGMTLLGLWSSARAGEGWAIDPSLTFDGALLAAVFGIRSGLIAQRTGGLRIYLRMNFLSPLEHWAGLLLSLVGSWLLVCLALFAVELVLPGAGLADAAWQVSFFAVRTAVVLPFVLVAEQVTTIEIPFFLPALVYFGAVVVLVLSLGQVEAMATLAPPVRPYDYGTLLPSLGRVGVAWAIALPLSLIGTRRD